MSFIVQRNFLFFSTPHKCGNFLKKMDFSLLFFSYFFFFNIKFLFLSIVLRQYIVQKKNFLPPRIRGMFNRKNNRKYLCPSGAPHLYTDNNLHIVLHILYSLQSISFLIVIGIVLHRIPILLCFPPPNRGAFKKILRSFFSFFVFHFLFSGLLFYIVLFRN